MKFIFADSLDTVDPGYDFLTDRNAPSRMMHWDDKYPHELMATPPYDGVLVSREPLWGINARAESIRQHKPCDSVEKVRAAFYG